MYSIYYLFIIVLNFFFSINSEYFTINKKGVEYNFVPFDHNTNKFVQNIFSNWESETFDVFDQVKDSNGIAIDLGAWIGTTAIWLSKNFKHVITVEADQVSLECLKNNLKASNCSNVSICNKPIAQKSKNFIFGPRGNSLNESISYIKKESNNSKDYTVKAITFKQLIHDFIYTNDDLKNNNISFIKCDIEGGEENIIEDILYFAYHNNTKVYLSFHLNWWENKNIERFEYLFKFFNTNCPSSNLIEYIKKNPFSSILFEPINTNEVLIKNNIPAVIIGYNQYSYIKNMVQQLEKYTKDIIIIDNNSNFQPLLDYYENEFEYTLLRQKINYGYKVYSKSFIQNLVGKIYILTDPDLKFNDNLPNDFIKTLLEVSNYFKANRVGFALLIDSDEIRTDVYYHGRLIKEWEHNAWTKPLCYPKDNFLKVYDAAIDTTFCLINNNFKNNFHIRIAGNYTCIHLPWMKNFKEELSPNEYESYLINNRSTTWFK